MKGYLPVIVCAAFAFVVAFGADEASRDKLWGTWQQETAKDTATWILDQKTDAIHVTYLEGDKKLAEFECNTAGRECPMKESGKSAKISMWFSGPKLVQLESRGQEVVKRRFTAADTGDTLELEIIPILPQGKPETIQLHRVRK